MPLLRIPTDGPSLPPTGLRLPRLPLLAGAPAALLVALLALLQLVAPLALVAYRIGLCLLAVAKAALLAALLSLLSLVALLALVAYRVPEPAEPAEDMRASLLWYSIYGAALKIAPSSAGPAQMLRLLVAYPHGGCRGRRGCWPGYGCLRLILHLRLVLQRPAAPAARAPAGAATPAASEAVAAPTTAAVPPTKYVGSISSAHHDRSCTSVPLPSLPPFRHRHYIAQRLSASFCIPRMRSAPGCRLP